MSLLNRVNPVSYFPTSGSLTSLALDSHSSPQIYRDVETMNVGILHYNNDKDHSFTEERMKFLSGVIRLSENLSELRLNQIDLDGVVTEAIASDLEGSTINTLSVVFRNTFPTTGWLFTTERVDVLSRFIQKLRFLDALKIEIDADEEEVIEIRVKQLNKPSQSEISLVFRNMIETMKGEISLEEEESTGDVTDRLSSHASSAQPLLKPKQALFIWTLFRSLPIAHRMHIGGINPDEKATRVFIRYCKKVPLEAVSIEFLREATCGENRASRVLTSLLSNPNIRRIELGMPGSVKRFKLSPEQKELVLMDPTVSLKVHNHTVGVQCLGTNTAGGVRYTRINMPRAPAKPRLSKLLEFEDPAHKKELVYGVRGAKLCLIPVVIESIFRTYPNLEVLCLKGVDLDDKATEILGQKIADSNISRFSFMLSRSASMKMSSVLKLLRSLISNPKIKSIELNVDIATMVVFALRSEELKLLKERSSDLTLVYYKPNLKCTYSPTSSGEHHYALEAS